MNDTMAFVLAGGKGERLRPLTDDRAKPAVPYGGRYRVVDFVLSNLVNSTIFKIKVLTQFKSDSLNKHLQKGWTLSPVLDHYIDLVPAQMRTGGNWYKGSADAVYQNLNQIRQEMPSTILVVGADHIYRMDVRAFVDFHREHDADATVSAIPVGIDEARSFGVIQVDDAGRMTHFVEKSETPPAMPRDPQRCLGSMGIYAFKTNVLVEALLDDARNENSAHDFGKNIIPSLFPRAKVMAYDFSTNACPGVTPSEQGYWRDIGSIDAYWKASMDLVSVTPVFNLYNDMWPIRTTMYPHPPAKFVFADEETDRIGMATDSLVSEGCIISGGKINRSILSPQVRANSFATIDECILFDNVNVGRHARLRRVIVEKGVDIPPNTVIGYDAADDRRRFSVSPEGIVVVPKDARFST